MQKRSQQSAYYFLLTRTEFLRVASGLGVYHVSRAERRAGIHALSVSLSLGSSLSAVDQVV